VVAASLVPENKKASAVALMFTGLTLANVLGVPLGTALGQIAGWQMPFWVVAVLGVLSLIGLWRVMPNGRDEAKTDLRAEIGQLRNAGLWAALSTTVLFSAATFALFTYVAPLLEDVTHLSPQGVTWTLFLIGLGLTVGNYIGGRLADWNLGKALTGIFLVLAVVGSIVRWTSPSLIPVEINLFLWAMVCFAAVPGLQVNVMIFGKDAPNLAATLNIGAFNLGTALGAWVGGSVISAGLGLQAVPLAAGALALMTVFAMRLSLRLARDEVPACAAVA
jgi:DHA1 family inner membrane transport protein